MKDAPKIWEKLSKSKILTPQTLSKSSILMPRKFHEFPRASNTVKIQRILTQQKTFGFLHALRSSASWQRNEVSHASCSAAVCLLASIME